MSGICGIALDRNPLALRHLLPMTHALSTTERGEAQTVIQGPVGIGAQTFPGRLSGTTQSEANGRLLALAFHGNLYDLDDPRAATGADEPRLQALLSRYDQEGLASVLQLRGEFALALWDGGTETLYLATDPFRVHPLFYYQDQEKLVFSSRMAGLCASPLLPPQTISSEAIVDVVAMSFIPTPKTIFQDVKKLPPGHVLAYHHGNARLTPYWDISFLDPEEAAEAVLTRKLKAQFADAISVRLKTERTSHRIGAFLSGGVDSSTVTGVLTHLAQHPIKSFSIGFGEERFNETHYSRLVAQAFETEHHEYFVTPQDVFDAIPTLLQAYDEPYANASAIPTYFCAKLARDHGVDSLYAGDGGDELFAGNERYAMQRLFDYYSQLPKWPRNVVLKPLVFSMADYFNWPPLVKGKKYIQRASVPYPHRLSAYSIFEVVPMQNLLTDDLLDTIGRDYNPYAPLHRHYFAAQAKHELDRQLYIDLKLAISDNDLFKVTRATEAAGVTVRYPFLDRRLAEYAASVPAKIKMRGRRLRSFFKQAYSDVLPAATLSKTKHGFGLPIPVWLRTDRQLNEMMHDLVLGPRTLQRGYFRKQTLEQLVERHKTDDTSFYGTLLWNVMSIELWFRQTPSESHLPTPKI